MTNVPLPLMEARSSASLHSTAMERSQSSIRVGGTGISGSRSPERPFSLTPKIGQCLRMRERPKRGKQVARRRNTSAVDFGLTNYHRDPTFVFSQVIDGTLSLRLRTQGNPQAVRYWLVM